MEATTVPMARCFMKRAFRTGGRLEPMVECEREGGENVKWGAKLCLLHASYRTNACVPKLSLRRASAHVHRHFAPTRGHSLSPPQHPFSLPFSLPSFSCV